MFFDVIIKQVYKSSVILRSVILPIEVANKKSRFIWWHFCSNSITSGLLLLHNIFVFGLLVARVAHRARVSSSRGQEVDSGT